MRKRIRTRIFLQRMFASFFGTMLIISLIAGMARVSISASGALGKSAIADIYGIGYDADIHYIMENALCLRRVIIGVFPYIVLVFDVAFAICVRIAEAVAGGII